MIGAREAGSERRSLLWRALPVPPAAWAAHGLSGWYLAAEACAPGGISVETARWLIGALTLAAMTVTGSALVMAWRHLRSPQAPGFAPRQQPFAAFALLLVSGSLTFGVLLAGLSAVFIRQCGFSA